MKEEWCFRFRNIASHAGDNRVLVKKLVTPLVLPKEDKSQKIENIFSCYSNLAHVTY